MSNQLNPSKSKQTKIEKKQKDYKLAKSGAARIDGYVSSRDKHDQAKRDQRSADKPTQNSTNSFTNSSEMEK
jgi:hypothetical protein